MLLKHNKSLMVSLGDYKVCYLREKYCGVGKHEIFTESLFRVYFLELRQSSAFVVKGITIK